MSKTVSHSSLIDDEGRVYNFEEIGETSWISRLFGKKKWYRYRAVCHIGGFFEVSTEYFDERPE
ncbi:hypothetical protein EVB55_240 [Rhizobium phage RHph_Y68]|uniref:Uncharacterized protein n=1 Tax=Rhizobium phage RHph_Y68 TaxID=2509787 RepID=A0A7S5URT2_9CAUD|nr:hypothetical protein PP934_gp240 [Rhizobium phage RHph_Y68]QIG68175.1 hypothetical protein EVB55_240 [Rhizobium phage RHph_Y68]